MPPQSTLFNYLLLTHIRDLLLPLTSSITINTQDADFLAAQASTIEACVNEILDTGPESVLVTGIGAERKTTKNVFYTDSGLQKSWTWQRPPHAYQCADSRLSASIAAHIGHRFDPVTAIEKVQSFIWYALKIRAV